MLLKNKFHDVIVVGGGLAGLMQSILLAQNGISVLCLDKLDSKSVQNSPLYKRTTAISYGSHQLIKAMGLWDKVEPYACPIKKIDVLDDSSLTLLDFNITDDEKVLNASAFGWVIENHRLYDILSRALKKLKMATYTSGVAVEDILKNAEEIIIQCNNKKQYSGALLIGADGRQSFIRQAVGIESEEFNYNQKAVISIVTHENAHNFTAIEHFRSSGPFAILPMMDDKKGNHRSSIVWTEESDTSTPIMTFNEETYLIALREQFPAQYGQIISTTERFAYPLGYIHAHDYISQRTVLIGDAAHGIHPIAGQGLNLGLRDVACLSDLLIKQKNSNNDLGSLNLLQEYEQQRKTDNTLMAFSTDSINRIFSNKRPITRIGRKVGLRLIDKIKPMKKIILSQTMGTAGNVPNIIKNGKI